MTQYEILSNVAVPEFPEEWYEHADENHFWVKWRIAAFRNQLAALKIPIGDRLRGLEIGCAHGVVQSQIEQWTEWEVDGCDLNPVALGMGYKGKGLNYLYDIHDRREMLREAYDFLVLFDVIEHIEEVAPFVDSALFHLKPGGLVFVNVPALEWLYSRYDEVAGHVRRYDKPRLRFELETSGLAVVDTRYWGLTLIPLAIARKIVLSAKERKEQEVIRVGFKPPSMLFSRILTTLMMLETTVLKNSPIGTSLLAIARKPR